MNEILIMDIIVWIDSLWSWLTDWSKQHLLPIIIIILVSSISYKIILKSLSKVIHHAAHRTDFFPSETDRKKRLKTLDSLIKTILRALIFVIASVMIVNQLGINTAPLMASAGIIGVALGFGAQSLIRDFMSGLFIILENQYRIGDVVDLAANMGGVRISGTVEAITIRTTIIRDQDGRLHHIPNGNIMVTSNLTMNFAGFNEDLIVDSSTDIDKLERLINNLGEKLSKDPKFSKKIIQPPYFARIDKIGNEGMLVKVFGRTTPGEQWRVRGEFYKRLQPLLEKNNIQLKQQLVTKLK